MALSLITKAWPIVMQTGRKFVLVALCDAANDDGECFLCVETIAYKCGMGLRTVQGHLIDLEADRFIWREERLGRSSIYSVNVVTLEDAEKNPLWVKRQLMKRTPAKVAGVKTPRTPAEPAHPPAVLAEAPAETAPITVAYPSPSRNTGESADAPHLDIPSDLLSDWIAVRKAKRAGPLTKTAITCLTREAAKAGIDLQTAVTACCEYGWQGFNAQWYAERTAGKPSAAPINKQEALEARNREVARKWAAGEQA